ncbi:ELWxxDGT repeat protein [Archangium sp.]|uniref:ELWxxDGT repeat protein n=1 Tax=Archangium sp. TaxID=1872627 RepID=UPI002D6CF1FF|nr:ELWxxDGT repeat protein [Archangium sp.]HYO58366.1 ELWxxDGT repeat protein [Archangium sp.]
MRVWRGVVLLCSLAVGCGGPLPEETLQEDERPQASSPVEDGDEAPAAQWGRPKLGTARMVKDLFPPSEVPPRLAPGPESLVEFRGKLYFAVNLEDGRRGLWKSNGTAAGTVPVKEFPPLPSPASPSPVAELTPVGSRLFFVVADEAHGNELWVSDGTSGGTRLVKDLTPGRGDSFPYNLTAVGKTLLFFRYIPGTPDAPGRTELWRSDGTEAGTVRVRDMGPESSLTFSQVLVGGTLFFVFTDPAHGTELWKSDGTEAGTMLVGDLQPGPDSSNPFHLRAVGRYVFFITTTSDGVSRLWRTDGTEAGTVLVEEFPPGPDTSNPRLLGVVGRSLYFTLTHLSDHRLYLYRLKVDGSGGISSRLVAALPNPFADEPDADPYITTFTVAGGKLFFALAISSTGPAPRDVQLWVTDGTRSGTKLLHRPLSLSDEFESQLHTLDDRILFSAIGEGTGLEPWVSNGTVRGTRMVQDLSPGPGSSYPSGFTRVGSSVFFVAHEPVHGNELWVLPLRRPLASDSE